MRERKTGRLLALLLVAALLLSLLPATVLAVDTGAATTSNDEFMRIVHLDCGRKYFSVKWVKSLIDKMAEYGYTHLELAFGNDGLRFLLNDMDIDTDGDGTANYQSDAVKAEIQNGNKHYYNAGATNEWSETDMTQIIRYAGENGISIIPLLNTPGHMDAIVYAMDELGIQNAAFAPNSNPSDTTVSLENTEAVAFTQALVKKYVDYFAEQRCEYFNLGADEYGNDVLTGDGMGFGYLSRNGHYPTFINYVNTLADYVNTNGMTPIVFNDGVCYDDYIEQTISKYVLVSYWSSGGWSGYDVASAQFLSNQGYSLINTHGDYYYVLNKFDTNVDSLKNTIANTPFSNTAFMGSQVNYPAGSMFCIWCDFPGTATEEKIYDDVVTGGILSSMATAMKDKTTTSPTDPKPDYTREETISLAEGDTFTVTVQGDNLSGETYNPKPTGYANVNVTYTPGDKITADGYWERVTGGVDGIVSGEEYLIIANEDSVGKDGGHILTTFGGTETISANQGATIPDSAVEDTYKFVITKTNDEYTLKGTTGFLYPDASWSEGFWGIGRGWNYSISKNESNSQDVSITENTTANTFKISRNVVSQNQNTTAQLNYEEGRWSATINASQNGHPFFLYRYVPGEITPEPGTNTITFTGVKAGKTSVVIGDTKYNITVLAEELSNVDPLKVEYWITNSYTYDESKNNSCEIQATDLGVYSKDGAELATLLPEYTDKDGRDVLYWQSRLLDKSIPNLSSDHTQAQTTLGGDDETFSGSQITKVRYWQGTWSVYTDDGSWVDVEPKHQLVAYYLEILPVAKELFVTAADWGKKGDGSTSGDYTDLQNPCTISVQVIYEDNSKNPASTSAEDLASRTIVYNYWVPSRGIGTLNLKGLEGYQIWKIEAETGEMSGSASSYNDSYGTYTVRSFKWDKNTKTVYEGDPVDSFVIHNNAKSPSSSPDYYQNLQWDESKEAILIKVYVKAPVTEDSLTVHYRVNGTDVEFYNYSISVREGILFNPQIKLNESTPIGPLENGTVDNVFGEPQTVTSDLKTMSEIGAQYRYSNFTCVKVERSTNGKDVYLYYTFENTHDFVIDFGLPLTISAQDLGLTEVDWEGATVNQSCKFGSASINTTAKTITYTPNKVLTTVDTITLYFTDVNDGTVSHQIFIYPASNVLYEETFLTVASNMGSTDYADWRHSGEAATTPQSALQTSLYGYDDAYKYSTDNSMGSAWTISDLIYGNGSKYLTTTFYGNAFDLIGTAGPDTGYVYIYLEGEQNTFVIIDTSYVDGKETTLNQVPLAHVELTEGEYTAYIRAAYRAASGGSSAAASRSAASTFSLMSASSPLDEVYEVLAEFERDGFAIDDIEFVSVDENSVLSESADAQVTLFSMPATNSDTDTTAAKSAPTRHDGTTVTIDGFRVYRKAIGSDFVAAYEQAGENNFEYINILKATLTGDDDSDFPSFAYVEGGGGEYTQETYEESGGPQNELYLKPGHGVVIRVDGQGAAQISARAVTDSCVFSVLVEGATQPYTASHNTELYYAAPDTGVITIVNNSKTNMLALGNLKILGDATVSTLSTEDVQAACLMLASAFPVEPGDTEEPGDIEEPEVPVEPETPAVFEPGKLDVKVNSTKILFNKLVTVTVSASADVDKLTINGKTLYPTNSLLVKWGLSKTYTYIYVDTVKRTESKSYKVVAYNADGLASAPVTVQG